MNPTEGLYSYELLLATCGLILFACLIRIIILKANRGEPIRVELMGFVMPLVMIGFPAIQKIQYEDGKLTIDKYVKILERNPESPEARANLEETLANVERRAGIDEQGKVDLEEVAPETVLYVADGKRALGEYAAAFKQASLVLEADPSIEKATQIRDQAANSLITDQFVTERYLTASSPATIDVLKDAANIVKAQEHRSPQLDEALIATLKGIGNNTEAAERLQKLNQDHPNFSVDSMLEEVLTESRAERPTSDIDSGL